MSARGAASRAGPPLVACVLALAVPTPARAGELQVDAGLSARTSAWRGDGGGGGWLGGGYRFARVVALDFLVWEELLSVDRRLNTGLTLGLTGTLPWEKVRPSLRVYAVHQHEEGLVSVAEHPFTTVLGIGPGIRHRAGGGARLGVEVPFAKSKRVEYVVLGGLEGTWLGPRALGPSAYYGLTAGLGINYRVEDLP